jgi:hypothetical protein
MVEGRDRMTILIIGIVLAVVFILLLIGAVIVAGSKHRQP